MQWVHIKTSSQVAEAKPQHGEVRSHVKTNTLLHAKQDQESVQEVHTYPAATEPKCMSYARALLAARGGAGPTCAASLLLPRREKPDISAT